MSWLHASPEGITIAVRVVPRASRDEISEVLDNALKVRLQAPPLEGKANAALVRFLSKVLNIPKGHVSIRTGAKGRNKQVLLKGLSAEQVHDRLSPR